MIKIDRCRSCNAPGVWMITNRGKNILVEPEGIDEAELEFVEGKPLFDPQTHTAHFANCPHADKWRRGQ